MQFHAKRRSEIAPCQPIYISTSTIHHPPSTQTVLFGATVLPNRHKNKRDNLHAIELQRIATVPCYCCLSEFPVCELFLFECIAVLLPSAAFLKFFSIFIQQVFLTIFHLGPICPLYVCLLAAMLPDWTVSQGSLRA